MKTTLPPRSILYWRCLTIFLFSVLFFPAIVMATVSFTLQPTNKTVCANTDTSFTVTATGSGTLTYQWQVSTNGGVSYTTITPSALYNGNSTSTLHITGVTFSMNSFRYQCVVTDASGSVTSATGILTVNPSPVVQTVNEAHTICANGGGTLTSFLVAGQTYQWQASADNGASFNNISDGVNYTGTSTDVLVISNPTSLNGYLYRYVASLPTGCTASSSLDTLHVLQPVINTQPVATTICVGASSATFNVVASSPTNLAYQWQLGTSNISNNATYSGVNTSTLTINNPSAAMDRQLYRVVVKDTLPCTTNSSQVRLFVLTPPSINSQPQSPSTCAGLNTSLTVSATAASPSGIAALTYQWQTDNGTNGAGWSDVSGGTSATLSLLAIPISMNGYRYRVNISTGSCGSITSAAGILSVRSSGTWLGAVDTNWHVSGNWCGGVPTSSTDVLIPNWAPRMPTISNTTGIAYSRSLTIENNAKLTIFGGSTSMSGPFDIQGTVAYTANANQPILPADHGSLEINGSGNKLLQLNTGIVHNLVLGGLAKLVTANNILTLKTGSNPINGAVFSSAATSWIVTGNGSSGASNTGLGGLRYEKLDAANGTVIFPIGPTSASFNPARLLNSGTTDDYTVTVADQPIPGALADLSIDRNWLITETVKGGSNVLLQLQWNNGEEQTAFVRGQSEIIRGNGVSIVEKSATAAAAGPNPYTRGEGSFVAMSRFSVATYASGTVLPVKLLSFSARKLSAATAIVLWETDVENNAVSYEIERSEDGQHFATIGMVQGEPGKTLYNFTDTKIAANINWYRLHILPAGKEGFYSRTVQLFNYDNLVRASLRPSVTDRQQTNLSLSLSQNEHLIIRLLDITGRVYWQQSVELPKGEHSLPLNIGSLLKGIYYVQIAGSHTYTKQVLPLIKQ